MGKLPSKSDVFIVLGNLVVNLQRLHVLHQVLYIIASAMAPIKHHQEILHM